MSVPHAAGALFSTIEDLYLWDRLLYTDSIISQKSVEQMYIPYLSNYGYGWRIGQNADGQKTVGHGGVINGFHNYMIRNISNDTVIIILSNLECSLKGVIQTIQNNI